MFIVPFKGLIITFNNKASIILLKQKLSKENENEILCKMQLF